ncbi:glycerol-3-phosphate acyltransferase [Vallitalea longa]|uniref:Glycerol-3-phosphate acyltransferase n=1 Tax=Vallitalea longa TaxID=2936439 RepID=A0A9W5YGY4_9FIRM|nr:glycerol-3-phosphate 1-O-acyltransferase PlsY [Vallitalea longa]GKX31734.1 glycerol-3-phosphate acyltransferase [Vallitalea longa]
MKIIASLLIGYLIGCFQSAYIISRVKGQLDIRKYGSGNAGTTNVIRVVGWKAGIITFFMDVCKAVIGVLVCSFIFDDVLMGYYAGVGVVIGHNWPVFLGFRGGKGIAATIGLLLAVDVRIGLIIIALMAVVIFISRYVSLGSILMAISIPILMAIFHTDTPEYIILGVILMISALYKHRANIKRLLNGTENKLGHKKDLSEKE